MDLQDAEALGVLDDAERGVRHVHAHLDERRGHQHIHVTLAELLWPHEEAQLCEAGWVAGEARVLQLTLRALVLASVSILPYTILTLSSPRSSTCTSSQAEGSADDDQAGQRPAGSLVISSLIAASYELMELMATVCVPDH